jgi:hypothetical protein
MGAAQYLLMVTIVAVGSISGLVTLRDMVNQEYGDTALALENLNQSYQYQIIVDGNVIASTSYTDTVGSLADLEDITDPMNPVIVPGGSPGNVDPTLLDPVGAGPAGITFPMGTQEGVALVLPPPGPNELSPNAEGTPLP